MSTTNPATGARKTAAKKPSARRLAREFVLQALYQWQLAGQSVSFIEKQFADAEGFDRGLGFGHDESAGYRYFSTSMSSSTSSLLGPVRS